MGEHRWQLRTVPEDLAQRYRDEGHWTDEVLGTTVVRGLETLGDVDFHVWSQVRPWHGTFGDLDRSARSLAASLHARGIGPGDVVVVQMPNWMEAGVAFFAAAYLGATVVPIVHFYGAKEVDYILRTISPDVIVTPDRFGFSDFLATYEPLLVEGSPATANDPVWLVVGDTPAADLPAAATPFDVVVSEGADLDPLDVPLGHDPDVPAIIAFTSGTTRDPKGVIHSHNTILFETRQLEGMFPKGGPPQIIGAPVGHFIGMVNAFLIALLRVRPVHLVDVWDPGEVLRIMSAEQLNMAGGATYFITSLLDHPDFAEEHLALMPFAGLGGSTVPIPVMERLTGLGIAAYRSYGSTEHPSITGCYLDDPERKRITTDGHPMPGVEVRVDDDGEIISRGPDLCMGYVDADMTAKAFDDDGWYRTGDVGVMDEDGYLAITDRVADVIIRGGENIGAVEVEDQLMGLDGVAEVAVVAQPDDRFGERAGAVFRLHEDAAPPPLDAIRAHLETVGLAKQKWPEALYVIAEFPRTPSGKIQKFRLREQIRTGALVPYEGPAVVGAEGSP